MKTAQQIQTAKFADAKKIVREMLLTNNEWLVRGMMALYNRQTSDEVASEDTKHQNARGFNSSDAMILTSFSKQWLARNWLSDNQLAIMRRKMVKYAGQLARIARGEDAAA